MAVYFIRIGDDGPVKIGFAKDVESRRKALQVAHPSRLNVIRTIDGDMAAENWLHDRFLDEHLEGDWFLVSRREMVTVLLPHPLPPWGWRNGRSTRPPRVSWQMCWRGNPCERCQAYGGYA